MDTDYPQQNILIQLQLSARENVIRHRLAYSPASCIRLGQTSPEKVHFSQVCELKKAYVISRRRSVFAGFIFVLAPLFLLAMDTRSHLLQRSSQNKVNASTPIARILRSQGSQHQSSERDFVLKGDRVYIG